MNKLESRIARIEAHMGARTKPLVICIVSWMDGDVTGFSMPSGNVMRKPGETEEALFKRACKGLTGLVTVREIREGDGKPYVHPYELAEPKAGEPEKQPDHVVELRSVEPEKREPYRIAPTKPEPQKAQVRVLSIKEAEELYADRPHWMSI